MSVETIEQDKICIGSVVYLFYRNGREKSVSNFSYFLIISLSPRFLLFPIKNQLHSFVLESPELRHNHLELRGGLLEGYWVDCGETINSFRLEDIIQLSRERRNVVLGKLDNEQLGAVKSLIQDSTTIELKLIKELLSGLDRF